VVFVGPTRSDPELPARTERVLFTAEEFVIPTPVRASTATKLIKTTLWDRINLISKRDFA
jgi:hypothetical protein